MRSSVILPAHLVDRETLLCEFKCVASNRHHYAVTAGKDCKHKYGFVFTYHAGIVCCMKCLGGNLGQQSSSGKEEKNQQLPAG